MYAAYKLCHVGGSFGTPEEEIEDSALFFKQSALFLKQGGLLLIELFQQRHDRAIAQQQALFFDLIVFP